MSRKNAGRVTSTATRAPRPADHLIPTPAREDVTRVPDEAAGDLASDCWPRHPVSPARVGLSRNAHARSFNDPSNYLG